MLFSIVAAPVYTPTKSVGRFPFVSDLCSNYSLWIFLVMAILTTVRWFLSVVLICVDLIISHLEYVSMCFLILYSESTVCCCNWLLEHRPCFEYVFWWFTSRTWGQVQPRVHPYSEIISTSFKDIVMGNGLKVAAFLPAQFWLLRQPELVRKPFSWIVT